MQMYVFSVFIIAVMTVLVGVLVKKLMHKVSP